MSTNGIPERPGREARLLLLVVAVSLAVLLVLARFRFPAANLTVAPPGPGPLVGFSARTTFDDLAGTMSTLVGRVSPRIAVVEFEPAQAGGAGVDRRVLPALRVHDNLALVYVPTGLHPASVWGSTGPVEIVAANPTRELALIRVSPGGSWSDDSSLDGVTGFQYLALIGVTPGGPTAWPVFVGRADQVTDARWPGPVVAIGPAPNISAGALLFSVDGRFVGLAVNGALGIAVVPPDVLDAATAELGSGGVPAR